MLRPNGELPTIGLKAVLRDYVFTQGSGKTFTMGSESGLAKDDVGLIPRFLQEIFSKTTNEQSAAATSVSFLEVYGEDIFDLLQEPDGEEKSRSLALREDGGAVSVVGLTEVTSTRQFVKTRASCLTCHFCPGFNRLSCGRTK